MKPVCLVFGAGAGIGGTVAAKFAEEGYHSFLCRRSDQEGLDKLIGDIEASGGSASGQLLNAIEEDAIEEVINKVESEVGPIEVVIYNLGAQTGMKLLSQTTYKEFEWGWKMASFGLFRVAKMLCQPLNAEFSSKGVHVAHIIVDGAVDAPDTLGKMLGPEMYQQLRETKGMEHDGLLLPKEIAKTYYHLSQQHRSAWTHELDLRAFSDLAWWNHATMLDDDK